MINSLMDLTHDISMWQVSSADKYIEEVSTNWMPYLVADYARLILLTSTKHFFHITKQDQRSLSLARQHHY